MTPERYQQIRRVFMEARELDQAAREAYLVESCGDDAELRAEVEKLLADEATATKFLEHPAIGEPSLRTDDAPGEMSGAEVPKQVGRYRIIQKVGEGGMGAVYEAEQDKPRRTVALKVVRPGLASEQLLNTTTLRVLSAKAVFSGRLQRILAVRCLHLMV